MRRSPAAMVLLVPSVTSCDRQLAVAKVHSVAIDARLGRAVHGHVVRRRHAAGLLPADYRSSRAFLRPTPAAYRRWGKRKLGMFATRTPFIGLSMGKSK